MAAGGQRLVVGVDAGTESLRAALFDPQGNMLASASSPYDTQFPHPGWATQLPEDWWTAMGAAVSEVVTTSGVQADEIAAICVDTTCCTVVALDKDNNVLRPALLWMDMRSAVQAQQVAQCGDPALQVNGAGVGPVSAEWMVPKSLWIKQNEPDVWARAQTVCEFQDFINLRLTGRMCVSLNNAAVRWHCSQGLPLSMLETLGLPELASKWPQDMLPVGAPVGRLTAAAARHLSLPEGLLVAQGGADAFIGMLGLGVVRPGQMALLTGSSHLQLGLVDKPIHGPGIFGAYRNAVIDGLYVVEGGQTSTGSVVNWFKRTLVPADVSFDTLNAEAESVPPGCEGLACLDHFQGNRTPHTDPLSRGALVGLTLKHGRGHVFRSLMESVAFGTRLILDTMGARGYSPDSIAISGGCTRSPLWLQIHADVCNVPFVLTKCPEAPMLGCAVLAAVAAGLHPSIEKAVEAMVVVERVVQPNPQAHAQYSGPYERYTQLYGALKPTFHSAASEVAAAAAAGTRACASAAAADGACAAGSAGAVATAGMDGPRGSHEANGSSKVAKTCDGDVSGAPKLRGIVCASVLAADHSALGAEVQAALDAGCQWIHVDMFDGTYVKNFTIGPPVLRCLRQRCPGAFFDCHLAVQDPARYVAELACAGASQVTFHAEVLGCEREAMTAMSTAIRAAGMRVGVALAPETSWEVVSTLVEDGAVDLVLCMTVPGGFGGMKMMPEVLSKVRQLRERFPAMDIQVDGGITAETAPLAVAAGANVLVAGSSLFTPFSGPVRDQQLLNKAVSRLRAPLLAARLLDP